MPTLRLHGVPQLLRAGAPPQPLSARDASLLAWLALEGATPRARLALLFWPDAPPGQARVNLRQMLSRTRRQLGEVLVEDEGVLRLADDVALDAEADGELLDGVALEPSDDYQAWLNARRDADARQRRERRLARARQALEEGRLELALDEAHALLRDEPAQEEAHRLRMQALYLRGDRAAAIAAWDECKLALRAAFGIAPSQATTELGCLLLASERTPPAPAAARTLPASLRRPPRHIRPAAVAEPLAQAVSLGHAIVLAGPGGIGKSRWLGELAAQGAPALTLAAQAGDAPGAWVRRLLRALPADTVDEASIVGALWPADGAAPGAGPEAPQRALAALVDGLERAAQRGLRTLVIDDLQSLDALSRRALQALLRAWLDERLPLRLLLGVRLHELDDDGHALLEPLRASGRCLLQRLDGLDAAELAELLHSLALPLDAGLQPALAAALHRHLGGNPAFVLESLKALWWAGLEDWRPGDALPVPPGLLESVLRRLHRLSPEALQLAQLTAVARSQFSIALAALALGRPALGLAPLLAELEAAQVFDAGGFAHDLVAEAVNASLPASLRAPLHGQVAELLIRLGGDAQGTAEHLDAAGDRRAAADWHQRAAEQASARWQLDVAAACYERAAARLDPEADRARRLRAWREAARCWNGLDRYAEAAAALAEAARLAVSDDERLAVATSQLALLLNTDQHGPLRAAADAQEPLLRRALQAGPAVSREELARLLGALGVAARCWRPTPALAGLMREAAQRLHAERADDPDTWLAMVGLGALESHQGHARAALQRLQPLLAPAQAVQRHRVVINAGHQAVRAALALGEAEVAEGLLATMAVSLRDARAGVFLVADHASMAALLALLRGQTELARERLDAMDARMRDAGLVPSLPLHTARVALALDIGDAAMAHAALAEAVALVQNETAPSTDAALVALLRARCAAARGDDPRAALTEAVALDPASVPGAAAPLVHRVLAQQLGAVAGTAAAPAALQALAEEAEAQGLRPLAARCRRLAGGDAEPVIDPPWLGAWPAPRAAGAR